LERIKKLIKSILNGGIVILIVPTLQRGNVSVDAPASSRERGTTQKGVLVLDDARASRAAFPRWSDGNDTISYLTVA
jgi:hypothetical protein